MTKKKREKKLTKNNPPNWKKMTWEIKLEEYKKRSVFVCI